MMKNIEIKITKSTRYVDIENETQKVGNEGENLQTNLVFSFTDSFVDGQARLEYTIDGESRYVTLDKINETYQTPVKAEMTKKGAVDMQLVITEGTDENEIPKFKSNIFYLPYGSSINAEVEQPEEYEEWIDVANTKLNQVDNLDVDLQDNILTITKKDGTKISENVKGDPGVQGRPGSVKTIPVNEFPTENIELDAIYILPNPTPTSEKDKYLEYVYVNNDWELFGGGSVGVDLSNYPTKDEVKEITEEVIDEVINSKTIYEVQLKSLSINSSTTNNFDLNDTDKNILAKVLTKCVSDGVSYPIIIVKTNAKQIFVMTSNQDLLSSPSSITFYGYYNSPVNLNQNSWGQNHNQLKVNVNCSVNNGVYTISSCSINREVYQYLSKTNTRAYTPSADYHPATKLYVDSREVTLTQAEYDALTTKDANVYYNIVEE